MKVLGAILAGGRSSRFGSDKAMALLHGRPLIEHVRAALTAQSGEVVVCGRAHPPLHSLGDRPEPGLGPLGGLCAALYHAQQHGFDAVLTSGCDVPGLPEDLVERLGAGPLPAVVSGQRLVGLWPAALSDRLERHILDGERSIRSWVDASGAREVAIGDTLANLNDRASLEAYAALTRADRPPSR